MQKIFIIDKIDESHLLYYLISMDLGIIKRIIPRKNQSKLFRYIGDEI